MRLPIAIAFAFVLLHGCALPEKQVQSMDDLTLCSMYGEDRNKSQIHEELVRRKSLTDHEWDLVNKKSIQIGMSEKAFLCAWGPPNIFSGGAVHRTQGTWGTSTQYVFRACRTCGVRYVYVRNGKVTGWQD